MIELILDKDASIKTTDIERMGADEDFKTQFETSDRIIREASFKLEHGVEDHESDYEQESQDKPQVEEEDTPKVDGPKIIDIKDEEDFKPSFKVADEPHASAPDEDLDIPPVTPYQEQEEKRDTTEVPKTTVPLEDIPNYDIMIGKTSGSEQYGIIGESINGHRKIAIDLSETNTISLFGVQGGGKSYTIGTVTEMTLKQFPKVNLLPAPMASVIFHYSDSPDYAPEFTSMIYPNDEAGQLKKLKDVYGAEPGSIEDVIMLCPIDKVEDRKEEYPNIEIHPIAFHSTDLNVQDWLFLLKAVGNESTYINQLRAIMRANRRNLNLADLKKRS